MANPFKLEITLKQHTPIIHFQHDQDGATLRATEVKSHLNTLVKSLIYDSKSTLPVYKKAILQENWVCEKDNCGKILKEYLNGIKISVTIDKQGSYIKQFWGNYTPKVNLREEEKLLKEKKQKDLIAESKKVLRNTLKKEFKEKLHENGIKWSENDKVSFFANNAVLNEKVKAGDTPDLLAEGVNSNEYKLGVQVETVKVHIFSYNTALRDLVFELLPSVFFQYNFGTRQSKGFGCFLPESVDIKNITFNPKVKSVFKIEKDINSAKVLQEIQEIYLKMKGGQRINGKIGDFRLISQYFYDEKSPIAWEKPNIKQELENNHKKIWDNLKKDNHSLSFPNDHTTLKDFKYVRALLGLAELYEYQAYNSKILIKIEDSIKDNEASIQRFSSPLTFKYDGKNIYIIVWEIPDAYIKASFDFLIEGTKITTLGIPNKSDLTAFVEYALNRLFLKQFNKVYP